MAAPSDHANSIRIPGSPASRKKRETADQPQAASVPTEMSVSIVAVPWRRLSAAARWNCQPPQRTTGVASWSESHCHASNWSEGTITSSTTGSESAVVTSRRKRSAAAGSASAASARASVGSVAWYPACSTVATSSPGATSAGSNSTAAFSVAKLTVAWTPSSLFSFFSMRTAHEAQVMPSIASVDAGGRRAVAVTPPRTPPLRSPRAAPRRQARCR